MTDTPHSPVARDETEANQQETGPNAEEEEEKIPDYGGVKRIGKEYGSQYKCYTFFGYFFALANGCTMPFFGVLFNELLIVLTDSVDDEGNTHFQEESLRVMIYFIAMGTGAFFLTLAQYAFWGTYGTKVSIDVRKDFFDALLRQEIAYHDSETSASLNANLTTETTAIENGIGIKMGFAIQQLGSFLFGMTMSFYYSWQVACTLLGCMPLLVCVGVVQGRMFANAGKNADAFVDAGSFSQEVLTNVRTVLSLPVLGDYKFEQYVDKLLEAYPVSKKRTGIVGFGIGFFMFGLMCVYGIGLYAGARYVDKGWITIAELFGSYFTFLIAGMGLGQLGSVGPDIQKATIGANKFYHIMQRKPLMRGKDDDVEEEIRSKEKINGDIEFQNVTFAYASNPELNVLEEISFSVKSGQTLAIVGPSGSGKSTVISLLERFYDPHSGDILIDGQRIHNYDLNYIRGQIGLVSQMPLLFDATIRENIRGGDETATEDDIVAAASIANAHEFILGFPDKYDTVVGEMGNRLSGGQRQRIAIARAMLNRPRVLLLDEATSALDSKSEEEVQAAIDKISSSNHQTVIAIAHRLSTIKDADVIVVLVEGMIRESGNHETLMELNGVYASLVRAQDLVQEKTIMHRQKSDDTVQSLLNMTGGGSAGSITVPPSKVSP